MVISFSLTASVEHRPGYIYSIFYTRNRVRIKQERNWRKSLLLFFFFSEFVNLYIYINDKIEGKKESKFSTVFKTISKRA